MLKLSCVSLNAHQMVSSWVFSGVALTRVYGVYHRQFNCFREAGRESWWKQKPTGAAILREALDVLAQSQSDGGEKEWQAEIRKWAELHQSNLHQKFYLHHQVHYMQHFHAGVNWWSEQVVWKFEGVRGLQMHA